MKKTAKQNSPEQKVLRFIQANRLFSDKRCVLAAVSGGPDSVCLLHILLGLRDELDIELHIAHLDHRLRGAESEADAAYVARLAERRGLPVTIGSCDVRAYRAAHRLTLEEAAREARYAFLAETAEAVGADCVATGHTADDHAETVLMHLIRGSGTNGLRGLQPISRLPAAGRNLTIIRPLLELRRQETADYCRSHRIKPRLDSSNESLAPLRNKIRHQLIPLLESYNPRINEALARMSCLIGEDIDLLDKNHASPDGAYRRQGEAFVFDKKAFLTLPAAEQRNTLRKAIKELLGSLKDIESSHIEDIITAAKKPAGKKLNLPGRLVFAAEYGQFLLAADEAALIPFPPLKGTDVINVPGETEFPGWRISARVISCEEIKGNQDEFTAYLDLNKAGKDLLARARKPGDRFQPLGMNAQKELAEFMIDAKIPRAWRPRVPIVCSPEQIVWVAGFRLDERVKVTEKTKRVLRLELKRT